MINKHRKQVPTGSVEIRTSEISGHGTFAKENISSGEYITTLSGKPIPAAQHEVTDDNLLQISEDEYLILDYAAKVINHSCDPNCGVRNTSDLYAIRDIKPGEEITYDYSTTVGTSDPWSMSKSCTCGAANCRRSISNIHSLPSDTLSKYMRTNGLPDFIKRQLKFS